MRYAQGDGTLLRRKAWSPYAGGIATAFFVLRRI